MRAQCLLLLSSLLLAPLDASAETLQILYQDRPPYHITNDDGSIDGLVSGLVVQALDHANIEAQWVVTSGNAQIERVKTNVVPACSPGWFKKPERELFAKFSEAIYQDRPQVIVVRSDDVGQFVHTTLEALFADRALKLGAKLGYSYGTFVDDLRIAKDPVVVETSQDAAGMVRMLRGSRFDYLMAAAEEFSSLRMALGDRQDSVTAVELSDIPAGNKRYLMCAKQVSDDVLQRFNKALRKLSRNK